MSKKTHVVTQQQLRQRLIDSYNRYAMTEVLPKSISDMPDWFVLRLAADGVPHDVAQDVVRAYMIEKGGE